MYRFLSKVKVLIALCLSISVCAFSKSIPPNFLIMLGDDISANNIGCYGSVNQHTTPNIDKLAEEGIRFSNMFVAEAMCAPTRAELYSGLMPYKNGCTINHAATKKGTLSIVQHLHKLGYRVALTGKRHFKPRSVYPFEFIDGFTKNCNVNGKTPENWTGIEEFMMRNNNQPFCLIICSVHAHAPWDAGNSSFWKLEDINLPQCLVDTKETRHYFREYLAEIRLFDEQVGKARSILKKNNIEENTALLVLDENGAGMPGGKWTTFDWGVRSACIMKWPNTVSFNHEVSAIAQYCDILPTLIDAAGGQVPKNLDGKSLLPIIKGETEKHRNYAFFLYNSGNEGTEFKTRAVTDGNFKLIWNLTPNKFNAVRTINGFDYGYVDKMEDRHVRKMYLSWLAKAGYDKVASKRVKRFRKQPEFQFYDLQNDPEELNNLVGNSAYKVKIEELKEELESWMKQQGDSPNLNLKVDRCHFR